VKEPLDESAAWRLVLAHEAAAGSAQEPSGGLGVGADGTWTLPFPVTDEARQVLDVFLPLRVRQHFVVGQLGQSLDGRIATSSGHSHYINGPQDRRRLHRLRALSDAVVVGAGTVASDDPRLTVRDVEGPQPVRVVLDPGGRLDERRGVFTDGLAHTLWIQAEASTFDGPSGLTVREGVEIVLLPAGPDGWFTPASVLAMLEGRGLSRVLVEGGGLTVSRFLEARALDRLHVSVAPLLIGSGRAGITLPEVETLGDALRPRARHFPLGSDVLFDLELDRAKG
jgi:diaminohydroxyphosphoribosylaminopyrimidine deaminase/5-amino-6-(5-phosphoribosylamino)uracil reductase